MAALAALEVRFPVADWMAAGTPIWPLLRLRWFFAEWTRAYATSSTRAAGASSVRVLGAMAAGAWSARSARRTDPSGEDRDHGPRDIVFLSDGQSFARLGERWVERFVDPVAAAAEARGLRTATWTPLHTYHQPRWRRSTWIQRSIDHANLRGRVRASLAPPALSLPALDEVGGWLDASSFGSALFSERRIVADVARLHAVAAHFARRLARARPRLAFVVSFYSLEGMAFVLACRRVGVPVVDLQHGVQGEMHPAYAAWPAARNGVHALLPDRFWVWSHWEADVIRRWSGETRHAPVVGGNPWLDVWRGSSPWPGAGAASLAAAQLRARTAERPVVLVTLQFGLANAEQLDPLARVIAAAGDRLAFWIRLHPAMLERRAEVHAFLAGSARGRAVDIDGCTDLPLQALLAHADVHLTHSSSTVIEAAQFGIRSIVTSAYGAELFTPAIDAGMAVVAVDDDPRSLVDRLAALASERSANPLAFDESATARTLDALLADASPRPPIA